MYTCTFTQTHQIFAVFLIPISVQLQAKPLKGDAPRGEPKIMKNNVLQAMKIVTLIMNFHGLVLEYQSGEC